MNGRMRIGARARERALKLIRRGPSADTATHTSGRGGRVKSQSIFPPNHPLRPSATTALRAHASRIPPGSARARAPF